MQREPEDRQEDERPVSRRRAVLGVAEQRDDGEGSNERHGCKRARKPFPRQHRGDGDAGEENARDHSLDAAGGRLGGAERKGRERGRAPARRAAGA